MLLKDFIPKIFDAIQFEGQISLFGLGDGVRTRKVFDERNEALSDGIIEANENGHNQIVILGWRHFNVLKKLIEKGYSNFVCIMLRETNPIQEVPEKICTEYRNLLREEQDLCKLLIANSVAGENARNRYFPNRIKIIDNFKYPNLEPFQIIIEAVNAKKSKDIKEREKWIDKVKQKDNPCQKLTQAMGCSVM